MRRREGRSNKGGRGRREGRGATEGARINFFLIRPTPICPQLPLHFHLPKRRRRYKTINCGGNPERKGARERRRGKLDKASLSLSLFSLFLLCVSFLSLEEKEREKCECGGRQKEKEEEEEEEEGGEGEREEEEGEVKEVVESDSVRTRIASTNAIPPLPKQQAIGKTKEKKINKKKKIQPSTELRSDRSKRRRKEKEED